MINNTSNVQRFGAKEKPSAWEGHLALIEKSYYTFIGFILKVQNTCSQ